jgi:endonuclease YncB( thermonuclease family)
MRRLRSAILVALLVLASGYALEYFGVTALAPGKYVAIDGDSLRTGTRSLRLYGIDAPELNQTCNDGQGTEYPCGKEAARALRELVSGKKLDCRARDHDRYKRLVVICNDGELEINREMVRLGWAIAYDRHSYAYVLAERDARKNQRGMWYGDFQDPADYRAQRRINKGEILASAEDEDD